MCYMIELNSIQQTIWKDCVVVYSVHCKFPSHCIIASTYDRSVGLSFNTIDKKVQNNSAKWWEMLKYYDHKQVSWANNEKSKQQSVISSTDWSFSSREQKYLVWNIDANISRCSSVWTTIKWIIYIFSFSKHLPYVSRYSR